MPNPDFLATYTPLANDIATATGMDPSVVLGVIDTETGAGRHVLGNNIFGISPGGRVAQYPDVSAAAQDFVNLIKSHYQGVPGAGGPDQQAAALVRGGYNRVNPNYAGLVAGSARATRQMLGVDDGPQQAAYVPPDYNTPAPVQPAPQPAPAAAPPPAAQSEKDKALASVDAQPAQPPAQQTTAGQSEKDKALASLGPEEPAKAAAEPTPSVDEYGRVITPLAKPNLTVPSKADIQNWLAPDPHMIYGSPLDPNLPMGGNPIGAMFSPFARDPKTGETHLTLPPYVRSVLMGLTQSPGEAVTLDTGGRMGLTPEAGAAASLGASPFRGLIRPPVSEAQLLSGRVAEATAPRPAEPPPVSPEVHPLSSEAQTRAAEHPAGPTSGTGIEPRPEAPPLPAQAEPQRQAGGADITSEPIPPKTPAQRVRDLEVSVKQTAEDRLSPQRRDDSAYVTSDGNGNPIPPRVLAARDFSDPAIQGDHKLFMGSDDAYRKQVDLINSERNNGMKDLLAKDAGDAISLDQMHEDRSTVSPAELGVFEKEQPTDAAVLVMKIDKALAGPEGKQSAVRSTLTNVRNSLYDSDGNLETLPSQIYGARKNLTDLLKKGVKGTGDIADDVRASKHQLEGLLPDFDQVITRGAPQFEDYLTQWHEKSIPIDQQEFLQRYQTGPRKLTDVNGYLREQSVQRMLDDILQGNKARGVNKAKSLTDDQIENVIAVRNELAAEALRRRQEAVAGSDTQPKLSRMARLAEGPLGTWVAAGAHKAIHLGLAATTHGVGNVAYEGMRAAKAQRQVQRLQRQASVRKNALLQPPSSAPSNALDQY